jgi:hypothetical protein
MNLTRTASKSQPVFSRVVATVVIVVVASIPAIVSACGLCVTPGGLKIVHPRSLDLAIAIRRDLDSGLLRRRVGMPQKKVDQHYSDLQTGRILSERLSLREGFELLLIEDGARLHIEGAPMLRHRKQGESPSTRWVTGRDVLQALLERQLDLEQAVKRGLIILETTSVKARDRTAIISVAR